MSSPVEPVKDGSVEQRPAVLSGLKRPAKGGAPNTPQPKRLRLGVDEETDASETTPAKTGPPKTGPAKKVLVEEGLVERGSPTEWSSVLPDGLPQWVGKHVAVQARRIVRALGGTSGDGRAVTDRYLARAARYSTFPRATGAGIGTLPKPEATAEAVHTPYGSALGSLNTMAKNAEWQDPGVKQLGMWMEDGRASAPVPMVGRRDLQLLSQLCQMLINDQHLAYESRQQSAKPTARPKPKAKVKESQGKGSAEVETPAKAPRVPKSDGKTQEVEALFMGDRILLSANETWTVEHLLKVDFLALLGRVAAAGAPRDATRWDQNRQWKIAAVLSVLALPQDAAENSNVPAVKEGLKRLVQLEVDCQMIPGQANAVRGILAVLRGLAQGQSMIRGGAPDRAGHQAGLASSRDRVIVVDATMTRGGDCRFHAEQTILYTALLAGYKGACSVAGGKRPCTVCWLTLRMAERSNKVQLVFNRNPGGYWSTTTCHGMAHVAAALGYGDRADFDQALTALYSEAGPVHHLTLERFATPPAEGKVNPKEAIWLKKPEFSSEHGSNSLSDLFSSQSQTPVSSQEDDYVPLSNPGAMSEQAGAAHGDLMQGEAGPPQIELEQPTDDLAEAHLKNAAEDQEEDQEPEVDQDSLPPQAPTVPATTAQMTDGAPAQMNVYLTGTSLLPEYASFRDQVAAELSGIPEPLCAETAELVPECNGEAMELANDS